MQKNDIPGNSIRRMTPFYINLLLSAGIIFSSMLTRFNVITSVGIGPGHVLLVIWIITAFFFLLKTKHIQLPWISRRILLFWTASIIILCLGTLSNLLTVDIIKSEMMHDAAAFLLLSVILVLLLTRFDMEQCVLQVVEQVFVLGTLTAAVSMLYSTRYGEGSLSRFYGLANNPNQNALAVAPLLLFGIYLSFVKYRNSRRGCVYLLLCAVLFYAGIATGSDALSISWIFGAAAFLIGASVNLAIQRGKTRLDVIALLIFIFVFLGGVVYITLNFHQIADYFYVNIYVGENHQGSVRFMLWEYGIRTMLMFPFFGLGPGSYSGMYMPLEGYEAHNTIIDWGVSTGMVGVVMYLYLMWIIVRRLMKQKNWLLTNAVCVLFIFSNFHYSLRHPIFWFYLVAAVVMGDECAHERAKAERMESRL